MPLTGHRGFVFSRKRSNHVTIRRFAPASGQVADVSKGDLARVDAVLAATGGRAFSLGTDYTLMGSTLA